MPYIFVFALGACVGSFLNVVIYRLPRRESVVRPRSHCPVCEHPLAWWELIPLASYAWCRGRCRHCGSSIDWQYPVVEAATALLFVAVYYAFGWTLAALQIGALACVLLAAAEVDRRHRIIPNRLLAAAMALGFGLALAGGHEELARRLAAMAAAFALMLAIRSGSRAVFGRTGMGMGDVKLIAVMALFLGWEAFWVFYLAAAAGGATGLIGIRMGRITRDTPLPFAPFVAVAFVLNVSVFPFSTVWPL